MGQFKCITAIFCKRRFTKTLAGANEMAQSIKCLLYKRENLSLDCQHECNKGTYLYSNAGEGEGPTRDHWTTSLGKLVSSKLQGRSCFKISQ